MKTATKRSLKLYDSLTPKQQAAIHFGCLARKDAKEAERVRDAVEIRSYSQRHAVFDDWRDAMERITLIASTDYWRLSTRIAGNVIRLMSEVRKDRPKGRELVEQLDVEEDIAETLNSLYRQQQAMLKALQVVCEGNGFSFGDALAIGGIPLDRKLDDYDEGDYQEWLACFNSGLPRYHAKQNIHNLPKGQNP